MPDPRVEQLKNLVDVLKNVISDRDGNRVGVTDVLDPELLEPGIYAYNDGEAIQVVEFSDPNQTLQVAHTLKEQGLPVPVKLTNEQAEAVHDMIVFEKESKGGLSRSGELVSDYLDTQQIGSVPAELRAAALVCGEFKVKWTGISARLHLATGYTITYGKKGGFQYTSGIQALADAKAKLSYKGISLSANAQADIKHGFKFGKIPVGDTDYSIQFYFNVKGFVTAKAQFLLSWAEGAASGAFAGFGIGGEVGVQVLGKYGEGSVALKERALVIISGLFEIKVGVGAEVGASCTVEEVAIDGQTYNQFDFNLHVTLFGGVGMDIKVFVLKEMTDDLKTKLKQAAIDKISSLFSEEALEYVTSSCQRLKEGIISAKESTLNKISIGVAKLLGKGDKYSTIHKQLVAYQDKVERVLNSGTPQAEMEARLLVIREKLGRYLRDHADLPERIGNDLQTIVTTLSEIATPADLAREIADDAKKIKHILQISEDLVATKIVYIEATQALIGAMEERKVTEMIQEMLDLQELVNAQINELIDYLKEVIMTFKSEE